MRCMLRRVSSFARLPCFHTCHRLAEQALHVRSWWAHSLCVGRSRSDLELERGRQVDCGEGLDIHVGAERPQVQLQCRARRCRRLWRPTRRRPAGTSLEA
eukprot:6200583-Pleurochrysis_carterae.AAC.3